MGDNLLSKVLTITILLYWPISFLLANNPKDFITSFFPNVVFIICISLYQKGVRWWTAPLLTLGLVNPVLMIFPLFVAAFCFWLKPTKVNLAILFLAVMISLTQLNTFYQHSVFKYDRDTYQRKIEQGYLYPNVFLARVFQNKLTIYLERISFNFFALLDPNNYFFSFHPREIVGDNQNLDKFPFWAIAFLLIGLFKMRRLKRRDWFLLIILTALIINLSILAKFDRHDLVLYLPLSLVIISGLRKLSSSWVQIVLLLITAVEYLRLIFRYA
ncbi:MAG: hypothetical protein UW73_C0001G0021 [Microgenomates group bacterium GW2011_GWB1_44_8]|nr:MAG: hypothetical protein UW73_C0001G0021 [Microgenomates group bacterium GW2011_GWB1_44_8]